MHPQLTAALADERRRDRTARLGTSRPASPLAGRRRTPGILPRLTVSWTGVSVAAAPGRRRGRSWVIVISATRTVLRRPERQGDPRRQRSLGCLRAAAP